MRSCVKKCPVLYLYRLHSARQTHPAKVTTTSDRCSAASIAQQALVTNFSVKTLDLSHNMIGEKETFNFVQPDYTTGGEAAAEMLEVCE